MDFCAGDMVRMAQVYAPTAMKPACPRLNRPVKPLIRFSDKARMTLMAQSLKICMVNVSKLRSNTNSSINSTPMAASVSRLLRLAKPRGAVAVWVVITLSPLVCCPAGRWA